MSTSGDATTLSTSGMLPATFDIEELGQYASAGGTQEVSCRFGARGLFPRILSYLLSPHLCPRVHLHVLSSRFPVSIMLVRTFLTSSVLFAAAEDWAAVVPQRPCAAPVPLATMPGPPVPAHAPPLMDRPGGRKRHRHAGPPELHRGALGAVPDASHGARRRRHHRREDAERAGCCWR